MTDKLKHFLAGFLTILLMGVCSTAWAACPSGVCYVRPNGGNNTQCTGGADADYDGAGSGEACALKHTFYALGWYTSGTSGGQAGVMTGGDTLVIGQGSYKNGYDASQPWGCNSGSTRECVTRPIPTGTSGDHTKVIGCSLTGCGTSTKPEIWSAGRSKWVFSTENKNYVDIADLNLTDHATCGTSHALYGCGEADINELSGQDGIWIINTNTINITNVDIHGFYRYGLFGGGVTDMTVTDTRIEYNAYGGYNADHCGGPGCGNAGTITFRGTKSVFSATARSTIDNNGCVENSASPFTAASQGCYNDAQGGYGDAIGTQATAASWVFTDTSMSHNTSDGLDLLYATSGLDVTIKRSKFEGNAGQQVKTPNDVYIEDSLLIGNCAYFKDQSFKFSTFRNCRAQGNTFVTAGGSGTPRLYGSTLLSNGDIGIQTDGSCTAGTQFIVKNSILRGGDQLNDGNGLPNGDVSNLFFNASGSCNMTLVSQYNVCDGWEVESECAGTGSLTNTNPLFSGTISQETTYYTGNDYAEQLYLQATSPAIGVSDVSLSGLDDLDINSFDRGASTHDAGALEYGSAPEDGTPPPPDPCGDGDLDGGEVCDTLGPILNGQTCVTRGYDSGDLDCQSNCFAFDESACVTYVCGNGTIEGSEECEVGWTVAAASIARWELNDNAASATVIEETSTYAGTLRADTSNINTSTVTAVGKLNEGFTFNGATNDRNVDLGNNFAFAITDDFSVEAWVKTSDTGEQMVVCKLDKDANQKGWALDVISSGQLWALFIGSTATSDYWFVKHAGADLDDGAFHHVVMTYDGSQARTGVKLYVDGVENPSYTYAGTTGALSTTIVTTVKALIGARTGTSTDNPETSFNGVLDNVRIYDRDLTANEVAGLYNAGTGTEGTSGGEDLNSQTCILQGFPAGGTLACTACAFDTSGCTGNTCGDGILSGGEQCDDSNTTNGDGCSSICESENANFQHFLANYTVTDPSSHLSEYTHRIDIAGLTHNESAKAQRDFGLGYFDNFTVKGHYTMGNCISSGGEDCGIGVFSTTETSRADLAAQETALDGISLTFAATSSFASKTWKLVIQGVLADSAADTHPFADRYPKLTVDGTAVTVNFYSDPNYANEITAIALSGTYSGDPMRYLAIAQSYNSGNANVSFSGSIQNVEVAQGTPEAPPAQGCESTTTDNCLIPTLADSESGGACTTTGTCVYLCTNGTLSETSNSCTAPVSTKKSIIITGDNMTVTWP